jgi:hypothetical protein
MNLGDICLKAAASICIASAVLTVLVMLLLRRLKKAPWPALRAFAVPLIFLLLCCGGLYFGHAPLFVAWHRAQNDVLPPTGCLTYEPTFFRLYASYAMSRTEFDAWALGHPWKLAPLSKSDIYDGDLQHFGISKSDAAFATEPAPNGKPLRVYYQNNVMYVVYYAM